PSAAVATEKPAAFSTRLSRCRVVGSSAAIRMLFTVASIKAGLTTETQRHRPNGEFGLRIDKLKTALDSSFIVQRLPLILGACVVRVGGSFTCSGRLDLRGGRELTARSVSAKAGTALSIRRQISSAPFKSPWRPLASSSRAISKILLAPKLLTAPLKPCAASASASGFRVVMAFLIFVSI